MLRSAILIFTTISLLSGCVGWKTIPENPNSTAKARFVALKLEDVGINNIEVDIFDDPKDVCKPRYELKGTWVAVINGIALDNGRKDLSMPLGEQFPKSSKTEVFVDSNKRLIYSIGFRFQSGVTTATGDPPLIAYLLSNTGSCKVSKIFTPKTGGNYEVTYEHDKNGCRSDVYEIVKTENSGYVRQPINAETNPEKCN
jgi:hypothetical protein